MQTTNLSRRVTIAGIVAAVAVPVAGQASAADPVYALINTHRALAADWYKLCETLDAAEGEAAAVHGHRPSKLIMWRNYCIGGSEIDYRREVLLSDPGANRKQIEREYQDAKGRERAQHEAALDWDKTTGTVQLREQRRRAHGAERAAVMAMAETMPKTPAGAGVFLTYVLQDMENGEAHWHPIALNTLARALQDMAVQS
jgi:hypothetical protein